MVRVAVFLLVLCLSTGAVGVVAAQPNAGISSVSVTPEDPKPGETVSIEATVSNPQSNDEIVDVTSVYLRSSFGAEEFEEYTRVNDLGSVGPGDEKSIPLYTSFESPGDKRLTIHVVVRGEGGGLRSYEFPVQLTVEETDSDDPTVSFSVVEDEAVEGRTTSVDVTVGNGNTENLSDIRLRLGLDGEGTVENPERAMASLAPGSERTFGYDVNFDETGTQTLTSEVTYRTSEETEARTVTNSVNVDVVEAINEIRLTSVETTRTGNGVTVEGDAANVDDTNAESVLLSVQNGDGVSPTPPSGDYFVGSVEAGEFATFELTAETDSGVSSIPVEITYIVDGDRVTTTQTVEVSETTGGTMDGVEGGQPRGSGSPSGGGLPIAVIGAVVVLLVVVLAAYRWRKQ